MRLPRLLLHLLWCVAALMPLRAKAQSDNWFILSDVNVNNISTPTTGTVNLPPGIDTSGWLVGNMFGEAPVSADGSFDVPVRRSGVTITAATPPDYDDEENVWMALSLTLGEDDLDGVEITAHSTALALVMMNPLILHPDAGRMKLVIEHANTLAQIDALVLEVERVFPNNPQPFDDATFLATYVAAVEAVMDTFPQELLVPLRAGNKSPERNARTGNTVIRHQNPRTQARLLDKHPHMAIDQPDGDEVAFDFFANCNLNPIKLTVGDRPDVVLLSNACGTPIDALLRFYKVDIDAQDHRSATGSFRLEDMQQALSLQNAPNDFLEFETENIGNYDGNQLVPYQSGVAPAQSAFNYLDVIGSALSVVDTAINAVGSLAGISTVPYDFRYDPEESAVYMLRGFNGKILDGTYDFEGEANHAWSEHTLESVGALSLNTFNAALEVIAIIVDVQDFTQPCAPAVINSIIAAVQQLWTNGDFSSPGTAIFHQLKFVATQQMGEFVGCAAIQLAKQPHKAVLNVFKSVVDTVTVVGKVAAIGKVTDRITTMVGLPINPNSFTVSNMETYVIVVGDPFAPKVESLASSQDAAAVDPENLPTVIRDVVNGGWVEFRGRRFRRFIDWEVPAVTITDEAGASFTVPGYDFQGPVGSEAEQRFRIDIPDGAVGILAFEVNTPGGSHRVADAYQVRPTITAVEAPLIFPNAQADGDRTILIHGLGFFPPRHRAVLDLVGAKTNLITNPDSSKARFYAIVPQATAAGRYLVEMQYDDRKANYQPETEFAVNLMGPPQISSVLPNRPVNQAESLILEGLNFGENPALLEISITRNTGTPLTRFPDPNGLAVSAIDGNGNAAGLLSALMSLPYALPEGAEDSTVPAPATLTVTTPEGTDSTTFQIAGVESAPFARTINMGRIHGYAGLSGMQTAVGYANHNPAPPGNVVNQATCFPASCSFDNLGNPVEPPLTVDSSSCQFVIPASLFPDPNDPQNISTISISRPPNAEPTANQCSPNFCYGHFDCLQTDPGQPWSWEQVGSRALIEQAITFSPEGPADVPLVGTFSGPYNSIFGSPRTYSQTVYFPTGGGLIMEGDGTYGAGGEPMAGRINLAVRGGTGTVVTVRDAKDVSIDLDLVATSGATGLLIENSEDIEIINGRFRTMANGIVIRNSRRVLMRNNYIADFTGDGLLLDNSHDCAFSGVFGYFTVSGEEEADAFDVFSEKQGTAIRLAGGSSNNRFWIDRIVAADTGIKIEDAANNYFFLADTGVVYFKGGNEPDFYAMIDGFDLGLNTAVHITEGAVGNYIVGNRSRKNEACANLLPDMEDVSEAVSQDRAQVWVNNGTAILIDGGEDNVICGHYIGIPDAADDVPLLPNGTGIRVEGAASQQPKNNRISHNIIGNSTGWGLEIDGATEQNFFESNLFRADFFSNDPPLGANEAGSIRISNLSSNQVFSNTNSAQSGGYGARIENSTAITFRNDVFSSNAMEGLLATDSSELNLQGLSTIGNGADGMRFDGCSGIILSGNLSSSNFGYGMAFVNPPSVASGDIRIIGEKPERSGTSPVEPDEGRQTRFSPLQLPPNDRVTEGRSVLLVENASGGMLIENGTPPLEIRGVAANFNFGHAVEINNPGGDVVLAESTFIGNGGDPSHHTVYLRHVDGPQVTIGGAEAGNYITSAPGWGVAIESSRNVRVLGNFIGDLIPENESLAGFPAANQAGGVLVQDSTSVEIGGNDLEEANLVSGNGGPGILLRRSSATTQAAVENNFIGTDRFGTGALANEGAGLEINGAGGLGFPISVAANLLAANGSGGIKINDTPTSAGPELIDNILGQAVTPTSETIGLASPGIGAAIENASVVRLLGNQIGGHEGAGVQLGAEAVFNRLEGNTISRNGGPGVRIFAASDDNLLARNEIRRNNAEGIIVASGSASNRLFQNEISENGGAGILLTSGGNGGIDTPVIREVQPLPSGLFSVRGETLLLPFDAARIELFTDPDGEGAQFLAQTTAYQGEFLFLDVPAPADGHEYTVLGTDSDGNTSMFGVLDPLAPTRDDPPVLDPPDPEEPADIEWRQRQGLDTMVASSRNGNLAFTNLVDGKTTTYTLAQTSTELHPSVARGPAGGLVYFASDADGDYEIYVLDLATSQTTQLTNNMHRDDHPAIKPAGTQIAFVSDRNGQDDIYVMDLDGGNQTRVTASPSVDTEPEWASLSDQIVFASDSSGSFEIYRINTDGTQRTAITSLGGDARNPAARNGGSRIAFDFCSRADGACNERQILIYSPFNFEPEITRLPSGGWRDTHPSWLAAPGGFPYLVYSSQIAQPGTTPHLYMMTGEGEVLWRITPQDASDLQPACCF